MNSQQPRKVLRHRFIHIALVTATALTLVACGGGGGGSNAPAPIGGSNPPAPPAPPPPPPPVNVTVPTNLPTLFLEVSTDISVYNNVIGDIIPGNQQNFIQHVPASGETAIVATNRSVSYAESISTLKVFDDRVFIVNVSETGGRVSELNLNSMLDAVASTPVPTPRAQDSMSESCLAVFGDDLVFKVAHRRAPAPASGYEDGPLIRVPGIFGVTGPGPIETLVPGLTGSGTSASPGGFVTDACRGYFDADGNDWYDTEIGFAGGQRNFFRKDPSTTFPSLIGSLPDQNPVMVSEFAYDDETVYFAGLDAANQAFTVATGDVNTVLIDTTPTAFISDYVTGFTATGLLHLDADDGYVAFVLEGNDRDVVMLLDPTTGLFEAIDRGGQINQLQLLFRN